MKQLINIYSLIALSILITGFMLGYYSSINFERGFIEINFDDFSTFYFDFMVFLAIILNNSIVALLLSLGGYFTGGLLTFLVLFWNGINLGTLFTIFNHTNLNIYEFLSLFVIHGIFEFTAFIIFAKIGFDGYSFFKKMFKEKEIKMDLNIKTFIKPSFVLIFAAFVEAVLISNF